MLILGAVGVYMMVVLPKVYPLLSIFFYMIPSNVAIAIFPHEPVIIGYGKTMNLWLLASTATLGTILSAYLDYKFFAPLLNLSYSEKFRTHRAYQRAQQWFTRMPFVILMLTSFLPVPFYPLKFVAISSRYPMPRFMEAVAVGRFPRYYLLGLLGHLLQIPNWILFALFIGMFALVYYKKLWAWISRTFVTLARTVSNRKART
jgi:membrane protein YqaA with SNARE-associated domain